METLSNKIQCLQSSHMVMAYISSFSCLVCSNVLFPFSSKRKDRLYRSAEVAEEDEEEAMLLLSPNRFDLDHTDHLGIR